MKRVKDLDSKLSNGTKWSAITQVSTRLIVPFTNMLLARIISPEEFGVVATVTMITSFADMFSDAGFQKYIVQHEFKDDIEKKLHVNVAFWSNLFISVVLWILISIFSSPLASLVGNPGKGKVIIIAGISLIITALSSIQTALFQREFKFKALFYGRLAMVVLPVVITIPLAILGYSYWSLVFGTIFGNIMTAVILTIMSEWKPSFQYSYKVLKEIFSFSMFTLIESLITWAITWIGSFIVGNSLNLYYLGLFKTSTTTVNSITNTVAETVRPILFSGLSRNQNSNKAVSDLFMKFQSLSSYLIIPLGFGIFMYRDLLTLILLGDQWKEASLFMGLWGISSTLGIVFGQFGNEVFRSIGKPQIAMKIQLYHLLFLVPVMAIAAQYGYLVLIYTRSLARIHLVITQLFMLKKYVNISPYKLIFNLYPAFIGSFVMFIVWYQFIPANISIIMSFVSILVLIIIYFCTLLLIPKSRKIVIRLSFKFNLLKKDRILS